jgi:hypothetical protein
MPQPIQTAVRQSMLYFLIIAYVLGFTGTAALIAGGIYIYLRPHWTKIFFSYSHKDRDWAERIMNRLSAYNFRVYIDFGLEIQAQDLERELKSAIRKRDIFILLASKNSSESYWVQFEINSAEQSDDRGFSQWRDMLFLAIDDNGLETARHLKMRNERRMRAWWNRETGYEEKFAKETPDERARMEASLKKGRGILGLFPFLRRILLKEIRVFDLSKNYDSSIQEVEQYLQNTTRFVGSWASEHRAVHRAIFAYIMIILFFGMVVSAIMLLVLVQRLI